MHRDVVADSSFAKGLYYRLEVQEFNRGAEGITCRSSKQTAVESATQLSIGRSPGKGHLCAEPWERLTRRTGYCDFDKIGPAHREFVTFPCAGTSPPRTGNKLTGCCRNPGFEHESKVPPQAAIIDRLRRTHPCGSRRGVLTGATRTSTRCAASASPSFFGQARGANCGAAAAHNHPWRVEVQSRR